MIIEYLDTIFGNIYFNFEEGQLFNQYKIFVESNINLNMFFFSKTRLSKYYDGVSTKYYISDGYMHYLMHSSNVNFNGIAKYWSDNFMHNVLGLQNCSKTTSKYS